ncbi:Tryptophanyl-tRNA synthetase [Alteracholeplasma palmae J233]|uniref:Tryptophan--tRNA ligase n=1 Tax=Alteracholeplasma palmae (strain ATCC 49389 / J233) TaxID=1318466 RepID=U4KJU7_ALTPJ|nr:tryptophan--tRNA ligase [Alteracholeplasma palmae]CCV63839.1 Tryptophanyl-tRNA synthetase [Alteracholeplasma palmae J233]
MKRLVSGIKPTGEITLGNYIGALKQFVDLQNTLKDTEFFIFIADLHAITVPQEKSELRKKIKSIAAIYLACGLNPEKVNLFIQSEVIEHAYLGYIMESNAYVGEMERMTQYKDKKVKQETGIRTSLLTYPALMAADILMYDANIVPIGEDQTQHLELTRTIANRFNNLYGDTFIVPEGFTPKTGARIKSLTDPSKKMSKTEDNPKSYVLLLDDLNQIKNKIKSAVTDSDTKVYYDLENKPGISNLLTIYASLKDLSIKDTENLFKDSSYKEFKESVADVVVEVIKPIQEKYKTLINSKELDDILTLGAQNARIIAERKIKKVNQRIGLGRK